MPVDVNPRGVHRPLSLIAAACASLVTLAEGKAARAQDVWRRPHPAVRHLHRRVGRAYNYHVVMVDLTRPGVRFVSTEESFAAPRAPGGRYTWRTTSEFARATGADIAVNANYYDIHNGSLTTCGLAMAQGKPWRSAYIDRRLECWWSVGFGTRGRAEIFDSRGKTFGPAPEAWITEAVTGSPRILAGGEVLEYSAPRHALARNPRTILGLDARRETLYLMVVNGREGAGQGMTCPAAARVLRDLGASDAVNLDGGGSSALYVRAEGGLVSRPADRYERPVANHLGVVFDDNVPEPPPSSVDPSDAPVAARPVAVVAPRRASVRLRRAGELPTRGPRVVRAGCQIAPAALSSGVVSWGALGVVALIAARRRRDI